MSVLTDLVKTVAPGLATMLGGPLAGLAVGFVADKLGLSDKSVEAVQGAIAGMSGEQLVKLKEIESQLTQHLSDNGIKLDLGQQAINVEEAKVAQGTDKWWVQLWIAGWRPYIGWIGGTGIGYQFLLRPIANGILAAFGQGNPFPTLEVQDLIALVMTLLGSSALRSLDKKNDVSNGH